MPTPEEEKALKEAMIKVALQLSNRDWQNYFILLMHKVSAEIQSQLPKQELK